MEMKEELQREIVPAPGKVAMKRSQDGTPVMARRKKNRPNHKSFQILFHVGAVAVY